MYEILENKEDPIHECLRCGHEGRDWAEKIRDSFSERFCPECKSVYYYIKEGEVSDEICD